MSRRQEWLIPAGLLLLSMVPALAGTARLVEVAGDPVVTPQNARFVAQPLPVMLHIPAAIVYSMLGAFQFAPSFRRKHHDWHRIAGRILVPAGFVVAVSGLWMTLSYPWPAGDGVIVYLERLLFGGAMLLSIVLGIAAIVRREFTTHGQWMVRAYAIGLGAGTQVLTHLPWLLFMDGKPGESARAVMMGAGWVINVLVAEWIIHRGINGAAARPRPALAAA